MPVVFNLLKTLAGHGYDVNSVSFSRDGKLLVSGGGDRTARLWDLSTYEMARSAEHGEWVNAVCFAPSGQAFVTAARDGSVKLWGVENAQLFGTIQAHAQNASAAAFTPDGRRLVTAGGDGHVRVFNLREKRIERDIAAHTGWVWGLALTSQGDHVASCGADRAVHVWGIEDGGCVLTLEGHRDDVLGVALAPDDSRAATAGKDGGLYVWDCETGSLLYRVDAHEGPVNTVCFSPDGERIVTGGADHLLRVWTAGSGVKERELSGHQDYVAMAVFSGDGQRMSSCGGDGTVKVWEVSAHAAYAAAAERDPNLIIEREDDGPVVEAAASLYAAGKEIARATLKNGLGVALLQAAAEKYSLAVGATNRTALTVAGSQVSVFGATGVLLLKYDVAKNEIAFDRTEGAAAPWSDGSDDGPATLDPRLERGDSGSARAFGGDLELELERSSGPATTRYEAFERHGRLLARERLGASGHTLRFVQFDENTLYLLFDSAEEPTVVLRDEHLDVRDASGTARFRLHLRSLEPVITRRGADEPPAAEARPPAEPAVVRDPLLVHGLAEMGAEERGARLHKVLERAVWSKASDVHIASGAKVLVRKHGRLQPLDVRGHTPEEIEAMVLEILTPHQQQIFAETNDLDFSYEIRGVGRFRANVLRQHRGVDATFRVIPGAIPAAETLGLPAAILPLTRHHNGLVLVTGPAGQGKSTTIACLVDMINSERPQHIITVEDPIEFVHPIKQAVVNQREVGRHTMSFANALRAALREDPDVIVVGEMRDLETISLAITASETGHLVFGTLMTSSAAQTVDRVLDSFPAGQQAQIRTMLSESLRGIVSQQLVPTVDGEGRVLACEVLLGTPAVANLIRDKKTFQIQSVMQTARNLGMQRMDDALWDLYQSGRIAPESAVRYAHDPKAMETRMRPSARRQ